MPGNAQTLLRYARDTWASFVAMTIPTTGLPADRLSSDGTTSVQTSTTNIGGYMWSTLVAERLGIIGHAEAVDAPRPDAATRSRRWSATSPTASTTTGTTTTRCQKTRRSAGPPPTLVGRQRLARGRAARRRPSSVPEVAARAKAIYDSMDFGVYHRVVYPGGPTGRGRRHREQEWGHVQGSAPGSHPVPHRARTGDNPCCYDTMVSESRIATYIGIAKGELPDSAYFGAVADLPRHL